MIRTRKEMWTYIHKDMERNLISRGDCLKTHSSQNVS